MRKTHLIILILATLTLIIASGCGGGSDDIITPSSISNQGNNSNTSDNTAYIVVKVKWPEKEGPGSLSISSENSEGSLSSNMTIDTKGILIEVLEKEDDSNLGSAWIPEPNTTAQIPVELEDNADNVLPVIEVIVRASAYDTNDPNSLSAEHLLSIAEKEIELEVGNNDVNLNLGDYELTLESDSQEVIINNETSITATLEIVYPAPTDGSPVPTPMPVKDRDITFYITTGDAEFSNGEVTATATTGDDGKCNVILIPNDIEAITVEAEFQPDPDSESITETIDLEVNNGLIWSEDFESYTLYSWPNLWIGRVFRSKQGKCFLVKLSHND